MALVEIKMPQMGESVMEATIISWLKKEGDVVNEEEPLLEVATDKVDTEVPAIYKGVLKQILVQEGEVVQIGAPIAVFEMDEAEAAKSAAAAMAVGGESSGNQNGRPQTGQVEERPVEMPSVEEELKEEMSAAGKKREQDVSLPPVGKEKPNGQERFYSPLVKNIARQENITMEQLEKIRGTGLNGRVTKRDIMEFIRAGKEKAVSDEKPMPQKRDIPAGAPAAVTTTEQGDEIIKMDRVRKLIADNMVASQQISAHVHSFVEADVTEVVRWKKRVQDYFLEEKGVKLTYSPIFVEAIVKALKDYPMMNSSVEGDVIIKKRRINIGIAVALPNGNLIVPVIRDADQLNLIGLARQVNDLAKRARERKLNPEDIKGSTYTMTNVGSFGSTMGTPIIQQPNVGILAIGVIEKKPAVIETEEYGDVIAIRHKLYLSHSYDHRVIDGSLGGLFVKRVAEYLENFDVTREF